MIAPSAKAPPLRSGKWTPEEEEFANALIDSFKAGTLPSLPEGTSMRGFLAKMLRCVPKRVSKKFENTNYNGKQQYIRDKSITPQEAMQGRLNLDRLERAFLQSINAGGAYLSNSALSWSQDPRDILSSSVGFLHRVTGEGLSASAASAIANTAKKRSRSAQWGESLAGDSRTAAEAEAGMPMSSPEGGTMDAATRSQLLTNSFAGLPSPGALGPSGIGAMGVQPGLFSAESGAMGMFAASGSGLSGMGLGGMLPQSRIALQQQQQLPMASAGLHPASLRGFNPGSGLGQFGSLTNPQASMPSLASLGARQQDAVLQQQRLQLQEQQQQRHAAEEARLLQLQMDLEMQQEDLRRRRSVMATTLAASNRRSSASLTSSLLPPKPTALELLQRNSPSGSRSSSVGQRDVRQEQESNQRLMSRLPSLAATAASRATQDPPSGTSSFLPNTNIANSPNSGILQQQFEWERQTRTRMATPGRMPFPMAGQNRLGQDVMDRNAMLLWREQQLLGPTRRQRELGDGKLPEEEDDEQRAGKQAKRRLA